MFAYIDEYLTHRSAEQKKAHSELQSRIGHEKAKGLQAVIDHAASRGISIADLGFASTSTAFSVFTAEHKTEHTVTRKDTGEFIGSVVEEFKGGKYHITTKFGA